MGRRFPESGINLPKMLSLSKRERGEEWVIGCKKEERDLSRHSSTSVSFHSLVHLLDLRTVGRFKQCKMLLCCFIIAAGMRGERMSCVQNFLSSHSSV